MSRYARQMILPEVGAHGQDRLSAAHVLIVGAGGLGAPVLQYLAGAGIGRITIVDDDVVDRSNLHRQTLFAESDVGQPKAMIAAGFCRRRNGDVTVDAHPARLNAANAPALVAAADIVLDCADSFAASYILSDTCLAAKVPLISASALGLSGYVGGFCAGAPSLRAVFPDLPATLATCATAGVLGPVVGVIGGMQAQMTLSALLGLVPSPLGQLVRYDGASLRTSTFRFDSAPEPEAAYRFSDAADIAPDDFVVELRGEAESPAPVAPHAVRVNVGDVTEKTVKPAVNQRAVMVCRSGLRAWQAADRLSGYWNGEITLVAAG